MLKHTEAGENFGLDAKAPDGLWKRLLVKSAQRVCQVEERTVGL